MKEMGFEKKEIKFEATSSDNAIATVAIDANGKMTVIAVAKGTAKITVTADYKNAADKPEGVTTKVTQSFSVTVTEKEALNVSLSKTELLCYSEIKDAPVELEVTIKNSNLKAAELVESKMKFTVETSDSNVAQLAKKEFVPSTVDGTVKIKLTPDDNRETIAVSASASSKLQPTTPIVTALYMGKDLDGSIGAVEMTPQIPGQRYADGSVQEAPAQLKLIKLA